MAFNPDEYLAKKKPEKAGFDPDAYLATQPPDEELLSGKSAQAALEGFGQAGTLGYLPQLQAAAGGLIPKPDQDVEEKLKSQGFKIEQPEDTYLSRRDENIGRQEKMAKESPTAYYGGQLAGALATAPATGAGLAKVGLGTAAKGAGLLSRVASAAKGGAAMGALQNPGDVKGELSPLQTDERIKGAKFGALMGAGAQGLAEGIKGTANAVKAVPKVLEKFGQNKAFKAAGAMYKDFKNAFGKDRVGELGQEMIDSGMVKPGSTFSDVAQKSSELKKEAGQRIGEIYDLINAESKLSVDKNKLASDLIDAVGESSARPKLNAESYDDAMEKVITNLTKDESKLKDVRYLNDMIGEIDQMINHSKRANDLPAIQQGYLKIRQTLRKNINEIADQTGRLLGNEELGKELVSLNKRYGNLAEISGIAKDRVARESANQMFGLGDKLAGLGGMATGAALGAARGEHTGEGSLAGGLKGAATGLGLGLVNKAARQYGTPLLATGANKAGLLLGKIPPALTELPSKAAGALSSNPALLGAEAAIPLRKGKKKK